jgi:diguanylate cyclase (GGDEF)-like protein
VNSYHSSNSGTAVDNNLLNTSDAVRVGSRIDNPFSSPSRFSNRPSLPRFRRLQAATAIFALIWLIIGIAIGGLVINNSLNRLFINSSTYGATETEHIARAFSQEFNKAEQLAATIALQNIIIAKVDYLNRQSAVGEPDKAQPDDAEIMELNAYLTRLSDALEIKTMFILDKGGRCVMSSLNARSCLGVNYSDREYFKNALTHGHGVQFAVGRKVSEPSLFFSNAISNKGDFIGAVIVRLYSKEIARLFAPSDGISALIDQSGHIIASPDSTLLQQFMWIEQTMEPSVPKMIASGRLLRVIKNSDDSQRRPLWKFRNQNYLVFVEEVTKTDLHVIRLIKADELLNTQRKLWMITLLVIVIGLLLILFIERNLNFSEHRKVHMEQLSRANAELANSAAELYELATSDSLTGLKNHGYFMQALNVNIKNSEGDGTDLSVISLDIDYFKKINDTYGHPVGDEVIRSLAKALTALVRSEDVVGRLGGEEFAVLLPESTAEEAMIIAERIRSWCETNSLITTQGNIKFTCSFGVATFSRGSTINTLMNELDQALYEAKGSGRNRVVYARKASKLG